MIILVLVHASSLVNSRTFKISTNFLSNNSHGSLDRMGVIKQRQGINVEFSKIERGINADRMGVIKDRQGINAECTVMNSNPSKARGGWRKP